MKETAAIAAVALLALLATLQACLAAGAPWGRLAWGGRHEVLPMGLRVGSLVAAVVLIIIAAIVTDAAGMTRLVPWAPLVHPGIWVVAAIFGVSVVLNLISKSRAERRLMSPVAALLTGAIIIVALA